MPTPTPAVTVTPTVAATLPTFPTPGPGFIALVVVVIVLLLVLYAVQQVLAKRHRDRVEATARQLIYTYNSQKEFQRDADRLQYKGFDVVSHNTITHGDHGLRITVVYHRTSEVWSA